MHSIFVVSIRCCNIAVKRSNNISTERTFCWQLTLMIAGCIIDEPQNDSVRVKNDIYYSL